MSTTAVLNLGINTKQFSSGLRGATAQLGGFAKVAGGFAKVAGGLAVGGAVVGGAIAVVGGSLIKLASDAQETTNKFNTVFSDIGDFANIMAKDLQDAYGLSTQESEKMLGATGDLLTGFGFAQKEALGLSNSIQQMAVDLASFQNLEGGAENASKRLTSALTGETEGLKALGIVIRQDSKEFKNAIKEIQETTGATLQQAKARAILQEITKQSKNAIGDYARTSKQLANQLKLTGKIWDDLTIGVGTFLMEITGAEGATLGFNDAFRNMTDNLLGYLKNWKQNWSILKTWISDNIITIFTTDLPNAVSAWVKNGINNIAVLAKTMGDLFTQFGGWFVGFMYRLFTGDFNNAITKGLQEAFRTMIKWGTEVWDNLVRIFSGENGSKEFASNLKKGMDVAFGSKGLADTLGDTITSNLKNIKSPLEGFKSATTELKFLKYVPKDMTESAKKMKEAFAVGEDISSNDNKTASTDNQRKQIETAVSKGSIEAFKQENAVANKVQNQQLKELKKQSKSLDDIDKNQITVNEITL